MTSDKFGLIVETETSMAFLKNRRGKVRMLAYANVLRLQRRLQRRARRGVVYILARFTSDGERT